VKTVEANLSRIFQKLGIHSRRQLRSSGSARAHLEAATGSDRDLQA
jgi:DNA-binding NarL/FixJ family response regulator